MSATTADAKALARRAPHTAHSLHKQRLWALWGSYIALGFFVIIFLVPPFYTLMTSLKSSAEISAQTGSPWLVHHPTLENFWYLITYPNFQTYYLNSVMITIAVVAISMTISVLAAFSLARMGFWGSNVLSTGVFLTYLIPASLLFLPLFQIIGMLGLINSVWCLAILYPTLAVPFCTWIMIGYFSSIPKELDEAALIDGAGYLQMLLADLHPGGDARHHRRDDLRLHRELGRVPVSAGVSLYVEPDGADRRHHQRPDPRRRVPVGQDHGRVPAGLAAADPDLRLPDGLLRGRPDRRRDERLAPMGADITDLHR